MSFSNQVKDELAHQWPGRKCCRIAELSAMIRVDGSLHILGSDRYSLHLSTDNAPVARKCMRLFGDLYGLSGKAAVRRSKLSKANNYLVYIDWQPSLGQALNELGILNDSLNLRQDVPGRLVKQNCCAVSYLRGLFLGSGFVGNPKGQYHLELLTDNLSLAETMGRLLARFNIKSALIERRGHYSVYMKQAQSIVDFLALIGAYAALLAWEDVRILKGIRESVNRLVNCDTANSNKAVVAALEQLSDIKKIEDSIGIAGLPSALREIARARQINPQASIKELGEACRPALTKSAAYHRVRRLREFAKKVESGK